MRCVGIDNAKTGFSAISLVVAGQCRQAEVWKPLNKKDSAPVMLGDKYNWLWFWLQIFKPDVIAVEKLDVFQSKPVIRALSHHEGVALLAAKRYGAVVLNPGTSQSRSIVFKGLGNMSKEKAWEAFKRQYGDVRLLAKTSGGMDQMDAYTHALAAPVVLERR